MWSRDLTRGQMIILRNHSPPLELISRVKNVLRRSGKSQSVYRIATILDKGEYDYTLENRKSEEAYNTMSRKGLNIIMGILCGCWHLSE